MMSFGEFAEFLNASAARVLPEMLEATKTVMELGAKEAKQVIGTDEAGWPALKETTLEGWGPFPGKVALGYSPPDNPLLRTGAMRGTIGGDAQIIGDGVEGAVGSDGYKAVYHEIGTSRMEARPFLSWGLKAALPAAEFIFGNLAVSLLGGKIR